MLIIEVLARSLADCRAVPRYQPIHFQAVTLMESKDEPTFARATQRQKRTTPLLSESQGF